MALVAWLARQRLAADVAAVVLAVSIGMVGASFAVWRTVDVGPLTLTARPSFGWPGQTTLRVPPFGEANAQTHVGPARLVVTVDEVDVPEVEQLLAESRRTSSAPAGAPTIRAQAASATATVSDVLSRETREASRDIAALAMLASFVASASSAVLLFALKRRGRVVLVGAVLAFVVVLGSAALAAATFRPVALASPRLEGALAYVPRLQTVFSARLSEIEELRMQVAEVANQLAAYYADPRSIAPGGGLPDTYRVLHVSDLHLDPVGAELARSLARSYDASLVVDTGDIAILGTAEEARLLPSLVVTDTPVVFLAGNHDSATVVEALSSLPNFTVASTATVEVDGLRILPIPDPAGIEPGIESMPDRIGEVTALALRRIETERAVGLPAYDIVALHSPVAERQLVGQVPLILSGHTHSSRLYRSNGTVRLNSGTLGGMPYDPVITGRERLPHGASILYYTAELPRRLVAIDRISVGVDGTTTLDRTVVDESLLQ